MNDRRILQILTKYRRILLANLCLHDYLSNHGYLFLIQDQKSQDPVQPGTLGQGHAQLGYWWGIEQHKVDGHRRHMTR